MLPSDMNLNTKSGTVGYNNKILVFDGMFSLGKNGKVDMPEKLSNKTTIVHDHKTSIVQTPSYTPQASRMKMRKSL